MRTRDDSEESMLAALTQATSPDPYVAGIANLLRGDADRSVELLKRAASSGTADASNDLAAALLVQADKTSRVLPALDALAAADQALRIDPHHAPAAFNRSLALEKLGLIEDAASAWNDYRTIDPTPSWVAEARVAAANLKRLRDDSSIASLQNTETTALDISGDVEQAWQRRRDVLEERGWEVNAALKIATLRGAATAMIARHDWTRARTLLDVTVSAARRSSERSQLLIALAQRSDVLAALGDSDAARRDLIELHSRVDDNFDPSFGHDLLVDQIDRVGRARLLAVVLLERARTHVRRGDRAAAQADMHTGLEWIEQNLRVIADPKLQAMVTDSAGELFHEAIAIALTNGDREEAFDYAERSRGRSLLESFQRNTKSWSTEPLRLAEIRTSLAPDAAIIEYAFVHERLIAFIVTARDLQVIEIPIQSDRLQEIVRSAAAAVRKQNDLPALERAWSVFIEPLNEALAGIGRLAIVPDRAVAATPFAALRDARRQRFLIDDRTITIAPSASLAVLCSRRAANAQGGMFVLSIGATDFDQQRFPVDRLQWAEREARAVKDNYPDGRLLLGTDATRRQVVEAMSFASIMSFAGHSIALELEPDRSAMLLSPDGTQSTLTAREIGRLHLENMRFVMLLSCRSAAAGTAADGIENLTTAFLAAGVPSIVGALSDIEDDSAVRLSIEFHRRYRIHGDAASAFRDAVRAQPRAADSPPPWSVIAPFGGDPGLVREERKGVERTTSVRSWLVHFAAHINTAATPRDGQSTNRSAATAMSGHAFRILRSDVTSATLRSAAATTN